jgi:hypothetical protein
MKPRTINEASEQLTHALQQIVDVYITAIKSDVRRLLRWIKK